MSYNRESESEERRRKRVFLIKDAQSRNLPLNQNDVDNIFMEEDRKEQETKQEFQKQRKQRKQAEQRVIEEAEQQDEIQLGEKAINSKRYEVLQKIEESLNSETETPTLTKEEIDATVKQKEKGLQEYVQTLMATANLSLEKKREELLKIESALKLEIESFNKGNNLAKELTSKFKEIGIANKECSVVVVASYKNGFWRMNTIIYPNAFDLSKIKRVDIIKEE